MRVKIGPYVKWIGPYQLADMLLKIGFSEETCDKIGDKLNESFIGKFLNWIYGKKERKISVHIDGYDVWSLDNTLAHIIHPALLKLKEVKHGSPSVDDEDVPEHLRSTNGVKDKEWETDSLFHDRWQWVLDEMIWSFEQKIIDWESQYYSKDFNVNIVNNPSNNSVEFKHTGSIDIDGIKKHELRMRNGFKLFGKYYEGLWD